MKYCIHCGSPVEDNAKFCTECGGKQELRDQPDNTEYTAQGAAGAAYTGSNSQQYTGGNNAAYTGGNSQQYAGGNNAAYTGGNSQQFNGGIPNYTAQPFTPPQAPDPLANKARWTSIVSLVTGILSFLMCCCFNVGNTWVDVFVTLLPGVAAIVFGILSVHFKAKGGSKTMAVIGIVLGSLSVVAALIVLIMYLTGFSDRMNNFWSSWFDQLPME